MARDREGNWTYQFAVVVDDWKQDEPVVRGRSARFDGTADSAGAAAGTRGAPRFLHHRLLMKSPSPETENPTAMGAATCARGGARQVLRAAAV
jgi:hypothetical protein